MTMGRARTASGGCLYVMIAVPTLVALIIVGEVTSGWGQGFEESQRGLIASTSAIVELCLRDGSVSSSATPVSNRREVLLWDMESNSEHRDASKLGDKRWTGSADRAPIVVAVSAPELVYGEYPTHNQTFCAVDGATGIIVGRKTATTIPNCGEKWCEVIEYVEADKVIEIAVALSGGP